MTFNQSQAAYTSSGGISTVPFVYVASRDPKSTDINYPIGQRWINQSTDVEWSLFYFSSSTGTVQANWFIIGGKIDLLSLTPDIGGPVTPVANNINIIGGTGITTNNTGAGNLTINLHQVVDGTATTVGATTADMITVILASIPTVSAFEGKVAAFNLTDVAGASYQFIGGVRTDGTTATLIGNGAGDAVAETNMQTATVNFVVSGNNMILRVGGIAGKTIDWSGEIDFRSVV